MTSAIVGFGDFGIQVLNILRLDPKTVRSIQINIPLDLVTANVELIPDNEQTEKLVKIFQAYQWKEDESK